MLLGHLVLCSHTHLFTGGEIEAQKLQINDLVVSLPCSLWAQRPGHFLLFGRLEEPYFSGVAAVPISLMRETHSPVREVVKSMGSGARLGSNHLFSHSPAL